MADRGHCIRSAFERKTARLGRRIARLEAMSRRLSWGRLGLVLGGLAVVVGVHAVAGERYAWGVLGLGLVVFAAVAKVHERVEASLARHRVLQRIKAGHAARLRLDWEAIPFVPVAAPEAAHPFARDLNLTGERSLLHVLDTTRSREGGARLREWLLHPELNVEAIGHRQALVRELTPLAGFRDRLALLSALSEADLDRRWDGAAIRDWLAGHAPGRSLMPWVLTLGALSGATLVSGALSALGTGPAIWSVTLPVYLVAYFGLYAFKSRELGTLLRDSARLAQALAPFQAVLRFLEGYRFDRAPRVKALCAPLQQGDARPSRALKRLQMAAGAGRWQQGQLLWVLLNALVPWDLFFTHVLNRCKAEVKNRLPVWLDVWYDLEALCALAAFGRLQQPVCFPEFVDAPVLAVRDAGHPLIAADARVGNAFSFRGPGDVVIVTGSNMSGKSTFLRTLGVSLCLAYAGGPVPASAMQTGVFRLFTCIAVSDSVTDGLSHFYAEVKRLKALLSELTRVDERPLVFLIDEIFRGTNNRERLQGSRAYIRALSRHNGLGMVTTHDLELVRLAEEIAGIRNVHFRETIAQGKMSFDYRLHTGPCPTTNALAIMKLEGLPVEASRPPDALS